MNYDFVLCGILIASRVRARDKSQIVD